MASRPQRNIKARYHVTGPRKELVTYVKCWMNEDKNLERETVTEEMDCYTVRFPQGHSIRVTSYDKLKELGFHIKPRMVDMDTGDVVDIGGDPYDFAKADSGDTVIVADEDEEMPSRRKVRTADAATA